MRQSISSRTPCVLMLAIAGIAGISGSAQAAEPTATVIEYYHSGLNHYFITAFAEIGRAHV